jgi:hypothetical protein
VKFPPSLSESLCVGHNLKERKLTEEKKDTSGDELIETLLEKALAGELTHSLGIPSWGEA